jgi:DNA-binding transcriptional LysR family regulator
MKIDFAGIQAFVSVAELGGFRRAADELHVTQTALTRRVQNLEAYLGLKLLDRTTRSVALTAVGREFLPQAHAIVFETNTAVARLKEMSKASRGSFTLACMSTMSTRLLPDLMREYADQHPRNRIRLLDLTSNDVRDAVLRRKAELGIAIHGEAHSELNERFLFDDALALYCHESHPLAQRPRRTWRELRGADLIIVRGFTATRLLIEYNLLANGVSTGNAYEVQYHSTAVNLVEAGVGCAVLPWSVLGASSRPHMKRVELVAPVVHRRVMLFTHKNASLSPAAQAFLDLVNALFKGRSRSSVRAPLK